MKAKHRGWSVAWIRQRDHWRCTIYLNGQRFQRVIRGLKQKDRSEAQRQGGLLYADFSRGVAQEAERPIAALTIRHILEHEVSKPGITPQTVRWKRTRARRLLELLGDLPVRDLTKQRIEQYQRERLAAGVSARTVNYETSTLKTAINTAIEDGALKSPPCVFKRLPEDRRGPAVLSRLQAERFLEAVEEVDRVRPPRSPMPTMSQIVAFALHTGLRRSEIFRLRWDDIDWVAGTATVRRRKRGTAGEYVEAAIPLSDGAIVALRARKAEFRRSREPRVFGYRSDGPGSEPCSRAVYSRLRDAARLAGLPKSPALHTLRHTFATLLHDDDVDSVTLKTLLGHRDITTTLNMYVHTSQGKQRAAVSGLNLRASPRKA